jgi:hypothetical protein
MIHHALRATPKVAPDPYWSSVIYLLQFNGSEGSKTILESGGRAAATTVGDSYISNTEKKYGTGSIYMGTWRSWVPVTRGYLTVPAASVNFGLFEFTRECWVKITAGAKNCGLYHDGKAYDGNPAEFSINFRLWSDGTFMLRRISDGVTLYAYAGSSIFNGDWHHVALVRDWTNTVKIYFNGNNVGQVSSFSWTPNTLNNAYIGIDLDNNADLGGYMDDFRVTRGVNRYPSNFTPPTKQFPAR